MSMETNSTILKKALGNHHYVRVYGNYSGFPLDGFDEVIRLPREMPIAEIPKYLREKMDRYNWAINFYTFKQKTYITPEADILKDKRKDFSSTYNISRGYIIHERILQKRIDSRKARKLKAQLQSEEQKVRERKSGLVNRLLKFFKK